MLQFTTFKLDGLIPFLLLGVMISLSIKIVITFLPAAVLGLALGLILYGVNFLLEKLNLKPPTAKPDRIIEHE